MKVIVNSVLIIGGAAAGLAVGFLLRHSPGPKATHAPLTTISYETSNGHRIENGGKRVSIRINDDSPLATQLERDLSMSSGVTRWLYWIEALEKAAPTDFPRLMRLAQDSPTAKRMVQARWIEAAPRHLFDTLVTMFKNDGTPIYQAAKISEVSDLAYALFQEWPKRDPDAAIAALNEESDFARSAHWRFDVAYSLLQVDVERALRLMVDWHADDVGFGTSGLAAVAKWTQANPRHAAEFMLELPPSYSFTSAMESIGKEWAKIDPAGAVSFATSQRGELAFLLANSALKEWAQNNLGEAASWLASTDDITRNRYSPAMVEAWAKHDAASALAWCEENLTGSSLAQSVAGLVKGAAEKDVAAAATLVSGMSPSAARNEAAMAVAKQYLPDLSSDKPIPPEAIAWLRSLDSDSIRRVLNGVSWIWATSDPRSMAALVAGLSSEQVPSHSYDVVARELARRNPAEALQWAQQLPEQQGYTAGGTAFAEWRASQPEAAMNWLNELPPTDKRRQPFLESAIRSLAYHPQAAEQLAAMTPSERATARNVIERMDLAQDRRARLLDVLKSP